MLQKTLFFALATALLLCFSGIISAQATSSETAKIKAKVDKLGVGTDVTVAQRGGKTFHGTISQIGPDTFTVSEVDLKANVEIRYDQVKKLEKGYTPASPLTGHRTSRKTQKIAGFAAIGALFVVIIVVIASLRD